MKIFAPSIRFLSSKCTLKNEIIITSQKQSTMKFNLFSFCLLSFLAFEAQAQKKNKDYLNYIEDFKGIAIHEMERTGIPASIKLAQGILESGAGKSDLARKANNHFGIKCGNDWRGKKIMREDDDYKNGRLIKSCFRGYKNPEASYVAHSEFLLDPRKKHRYGPLFELDQTDYRGWAKGLKKAGYATSNTYSKKLIGLIEDYELYKFDQEQPSVIVDLVNNEPETQKEIISDMLVNNDVKYVLSQSGETVSSIAKRTDTAIRSLLRYNENLSNAEQALEAGTWVYIQPKRSSYRGKSTWHYVKDGEDMLDISILYGLSLSKLYARNKLSEGEEPATGERIKLRGGPVGLSPRLRKDEPQKAKPQPQKPAIVLEEDDPEPANDEMEMDEEIAIEEDEFTPAEVEEEKPVAKPTTTPKPPKENTTTASTTKVEPQGPILQPEIPSKTTVSNKPTPEVIPPTPSKPEMPSDDTPQSGIYHEVIQGDTLWNISQRYGQTVDEIKKLNQLDSDTIKLGMRLKVK